MAEHHDVTLHHQPSPDDEGKGIEAIIRAMLRNPLGAVQLIAFIGGMYLLYYNNNNAIAEAKALSEQHYKDLSNDLTHNNEKILAKIDALFENDRAEIARIDAIFTRGDTRWATVQAHQTEDDVKFAKLESTLNYLVRLLDKNTGGTIPEIGPLPPSR